MKWLMAVLFCLSGFIASAQTSRELIGKWKLVRETKNGVVKEPKDTYQVFMPNGKFRGIREDKSRMGKWKLSDDYTELTIKISVISITFQIEYFDSKKRIISSDETGRLEYEKVED